MGFLLRNSRVASKSCYVIINPCWYRCGVKRVKRECKCDRKWRGVIHDIENGSVTYSKFGAQVLVCKCMGD